MTDELEPCPFCGGKAEIVELDGDNEGGSCVSCTDCLSSGPVEFGFKENFISNWNRRTPAPSSDGGRVMAVCQQEERAAGRFYSRVCLTCKFGLCQRPVPASSKDAGKYGDLDFPAPNHFDQTKRGFNPK